MSLAGAASVEVKPSFNVRNACPTKMFRNTSFTPSNVSCNNTLVVARRNEIAMQVYNNTLATVLFRESSKYFGILRLHERPILQREVQSVVKINAFLFILTTFRAEKDALHVQKVIDNARIPKDKGECVLQ